MSSNRPLLGDKNDSREQLLNGNHFIIFACLINETTLRFLKIRIIKRQLTHTNFPCPGKQQCFCQYHNQRAYQDKFAP